MVAEGRAGSGPLTVVYACHDDVTPGWDIETGAGRRKLTVRLERLERLLEGHRRAGVPRERLVLAGQSCGAWASLLLAARRPDLVGRIIAFAPACHGRLMQNLHCAALGTMACEVILADRHRQVAALLGIRRLDALIYTFEGDPFVPPGALAFLELVPGVVRVHLTRRTGSRGHGTVWRLPKTERARLSAFAHGHRQILASANRTRQPSR